jgi:hypothetical protein
MEVDGVLVRLTVEPGPWAEDIPPVPRGFAVTVSFGSEAVADEHRDALELLGYTVVDVAVPADLSIPGIADFLVLHDLMEQHPTYWRSLAVRADRAYHLALGPAAAAVAEVVAQHLPLRRI